MMAARKDGRWGNTQENAYAMEALVAYYRKYESAVPSFDAVVTLGAEELAREQFRGRTTSRDQKDVPMAQVLAKAQPGTTQPLTFAKEGSGTLFYTARLRYAADRLFQDGLDSGFRIAAHATRRTSRTAARPAATSYKAGDLVRVTLTFDADEGAALRGGDRSAAGGLRAGRVVVRDDGRDAGERRQDDQGEARRATGQPGGSAAASITSSATTTASSCSRRGSAKDATSSATSSARRRPGRSGPRRRARRRCTSRRSSAARRRP